jgi:uncharacterized alkaline shock family protein YloU
MSDEIRMDGLGIAPGVLDTLVTLATQDVDGVAAVGAPGIAGLVQKGARKGTQRAVDVCTAEDGSVGVTVHVQVEYGRNLREVGRAVQAAICDAVASQVSIDVSSVDVYIDAVVFAE